MSFSVLGGVLVLLCLFTCVGMASADDGTLKSKVKAAYLYNFTRFVDWPSLPADTITICIVGSESVGGMLNQLSNRQVKGRPLQIKQGQLADISRCQILFIGQSAGNMTDLLNRTRGNNILTVSDTEDFARQGGVIGFYDEAGKVKLEINSKTAGAANLKISAKLMEIARIVP